MSLIQQHRELAEHCTGCRDLGDRHALLYDLNRAAHEDQHPSRLRAGGQDVLAGLVSHHGEARKLLLESGGIKSQRHFFLLFARSAGAEPPARGRRPGALLQAARQIVELVSPKLSNETLEFVAWT